MTFQLFLVNDQALRSFPLEPGDPFGLHQHLFFLLGEAFFQGHELLA